MNYLLVLSAIVSVVAPDVRADNNCVCNRHAEKKHEVFDSTHTLIGYIFPNDCATFINTPKIDEGWFAIQFDQETAYIEDDDNIIITDCPEIEDDEGITGNPLAFTNGVTSQIPTTVKATVSPELLGNVALCPQYVVQGAKTNGFLLTQHRHQCYEVCQTKVSWTHANLLCTERGGHLVTIHNYQENNYLHDLLKQNFHRVVWIGLHDREHGEQFQWTTGEKLGFTVWRDNRGPDHANEDCVVMIKTGHWDDLPCGGNNMTSEANQTKHAYICEYELHDSGSYIIG